MTREQKQSGETKKNQSDQNQTESDGNAKITTAMLNTIRNEQERTGINDRSILARINPNIKKMEDLSVIEYKKIMDIFKQTKARGDK